MSRAEKVGEEGGQVKLTRGGEKGVSLRTTYVIQGEHRTILEVPPRKTAALFERSVLPTYVSASEISSAS